VLAQRLVRRVCASCGGKGCANCAQSGYRGRTGIYELLVLNDEIKRAITASATAGELLTLARQSGMRTLREHGQQLVRAGVTTEQEVMRVTRDAEI
jgi:general secretion pathway protein E